MQQFLFIVCTFVLLFGQTPTLAQGSDSSQKQAPEAPPPIITNGLSIYKAKGPEEAIKAWIKGSPIDGSKEALMQANNLRSIEGYYGTYQSFEVVSTRTLSSKTKIFYLVLEFEKSPIFAKFLVFKTAEGWTVTSFDFNTKSELILP
jgi:hypothetical protein